MIIVFIDPLTRTWNLHVNKLHIFRQMVWTKFSWFMILNSNIMYKYQRRIEVSMGLHRRALSVDVIQVFGAEFSQDSHESWVMIEVDKKKCKCRSMTWEKPYTDCSDKKLNWFILKLFIDIYYYTLDIWCDLQLVFSQKLKYKHFWGRYTSLKAWK